MELNERATTSLYAFGNNLQCLRQNSQETESIQGMWRSWIVAKLGFIRAAVAIVSHLINIETALIVRFQVETIGDCYVAGELFELLCLLGSLLQAS